MKPSLAEILILEGFADGWWYFVIHRGFVSAFTAIFFVC